jgi:hypothetical protein
MDIVFSDARTNKMVKITGSIAIVLSGDFGSVS